MNRRAGFTLIELVVVIMILGILAGVAAPKFFSTSATATDNGAKQSLAIIRDAIELYSASNNGALPTCGALGVTLRSQLAPYIRGTFPICPVGTQKNFNVTPITPTTTPDGTTGWMYNTTTGEFIINNTLPSSLPGAPTYNTF